MHIVMHFAVHAIHVKFGTLIAIRYVLINNEILLEPKIYNS